MLGRRRRRRRNCSWELEDGHFLFRKNGQLHQTGGGRGGRDLLPSTILLLTILLDMLNQET